MSNVETGTMTYPDISLPGVTALAGAGALIDPLAPLDPLVLEALAGPTAAAAGALRVVAVETTGDGHAGLTADGRVAYRAPDGFAGVETLRVTLRDAAGVEQTASLPVTVERGPMAEGFGSGEHYVLARDEAGWTIAEPGAQHRTIYVSTAGSINASGASPDRAITPEGYAALLAAFEAEARAAGTPAEASWHVLFERGRDYGAFAIDHLSGEDPLHPFVIGAYGEGARPVFGRSINFEETRSNVLVRDLEFRPTAEAEAVFAAQGRPYVLNGVRILGVGHENLMFENLSISPRDGAVLVQTKSENVTFYRCTIVDSHRAEPAPGQDDWRDALANRMQGFFADDVDGLLIEETFADHNGWQTGYREAGGYDASQPPSMYSHNFYINYDASNVTFRDNISTRAASFGAQIRPGGFVDGNLFADNNAGLNLLGGGKDGTTGFLGEFSTLIDTVLTMPSNKNAQQIGARGWGATVQGDGLVVDAILAQDGDRTLGSGPQGVRSAIKAAPSNGLAFDIENTTVFNWGPDAQLLPDSGQIAADALLRVQLDRFAAAQLGAGNNRIDLYETWRERDRGNWNDAPSAEDVVAFFRKGFGYDPLETAPGREVRFAADPRAEGFRWDNRLNWSDDRGPVSGDRVDLDGHRVNYGGETLTLAGLDLGSGGALRVAQGRLTVESGGLAVDAAGGLVEVDAAGQFVFHGYADADALRLEVLGGRVVNAASVSGRIDLEVSDGQALLATGGDTRFALGAGSRLAVVGEDAEVGFDGVSGRARLSLIGGELSFVFSDDGVSTIGEFRSGRWGAAASGVRSVVDLTSGSLEVDLSALGREDAGRHTLIDVDVINGGLANLAVELRGVPEGMTATLVLDTAIDALFLDLI